jgi:hypothetical protein
MTYPQTIQGKDRGNTMKEIKAIIRPFRLLEVKAYISVVLLLTIFSGCGAAAKMITAKSKSERTGVFTEISGNEAAPAGFADVLITANIKTHLEGYYSGEAETSSHGKEVYPFLINIDGQAVLWKVAGRKHELPLYVDGLASRDPEAGNGMKYVLEKKVRLAAGAQQVFFGLPEEPYFTVADITVASGSMNMLDFKPKYWHKELPTHIPTFLKGINHYDIFMNVNPVAQ